MESDKSMKQANKEHFDGVTDAFLKAAWVQEIHDTLSSYMVENREWIGISKEASFEKGTGARILDFACGDGALSVPLLPYASEIRGMDISTKMVELYNKAAASSGVDPKRMYAVEADILEEQNVSTSPIAGADFKDFDLAFVSLALHHIEDAVGTVRAMASRVAPGGSLLAIEFKHQHGQIDMHKKEKYKMAHEGFSLEAMTTMFEQAGLVDIEIRESVSPLQIPELEGEHGGMERPYFYARGRLPQL